MANTTIDITQPFDRPQKLLRMLDNGDGTYSVAVGIETGDGLVSTGNTTEVNLAGGATFDGTFENVLPYGAIRVAIYSSHASATRGLEFWCSKDGVNGFMDDSYTIPAATPKTFAVPVSAPYFKIKYTNGGTQTTTLNICVIYQKNVSVASSHRLGDTVTDNDDAQLVKAVLSARKPNGDQTNIDATAGGNLKVSLEELESDVTIPVTFPNGLLDSFSHLIVGEINNDVDVQFYRAASPPAITDILTITTANSGTATVADGLATFLTTTAANSRAKGVSLVPVVYTAGAEVYMIFTAGFTGTGSGTSYHRIGIYNDLTNGFFIGYEANTFGVTILKSSSPTQTAKANFNVDTLVGGAESKFTRNGTPEAINLALLNVWRIRFGWVGSAPIRFEVLSPDGEWVLFHVIKQPNLTAFPSVNTADLYATCDVNAGNSGAALSIISNCWGAGTTQKLRKLTDTLNNNTLAGLTRSVITGVTTGGGGSYVNVKVNPSGALTADVTGTVAVSSIAAGTNNIGDVDVLTLPALPAGTNAIGKLLPPDVDVTTHTNYARKYYTNAGAVTDGIVWSPAAGKRWHVTTLYIQTSAASTITLEDDLAGGDTPVWKGEIAANSGVVIPFGEKYPLASAEDAADLIITTTAGNVYVTAVGYEI